MTLKFRVEILFDLKKRVLFTSKSITAARKEKAFSINPSDLLILLSFPYFFPKPLNFS
jgi:hypothetical protein